MKWKLKETELLALQLNKILQNMFGKTKMEIKNSEIVSSMLSLYPPARARHTATPVTADGHHVVIFGGYKTKTTQFNEEEAYGDKVETVFVESVPEGPDAERVMRQMVKGGADIIFATSLATCSQC